MNVNELIQSACEDLNLVGDGEAVSGDLAASAEGCLNRAISILNQDSYIAPTLKEYETSGAGVVYFRKLEAGESKPSTIDIEPPDSIYDVARKVGIRWMRLRSATPQDLAATNTFSLPQFWSYGVESEEAPSGNRRMVGALRMNGSAPVVLKVFVSEKVPTYRLGDTIYLSDLYYSLILYALEQRLVARYKLYSYKDQVEQDLLAAKDAIDDNALRNRPLTNIDNIGGGYMEDFYNGLAGVGF